MSDKEKFSRGKWYSDGERVWVEKGTFSAAVCTLNLPRDYEAGEREMVANGLLMSAAPEMYEFIKSFTTIGGQALLLFADNGKEIYDEACRILKKARGEE